MNTIKIHRIIIINENFEDTELQIIQFIDDLLDDAVANPDEYSISRALDCSEYGVLGSICKITKKTSDCDLTISISLGLYYNTLSTSIKNHEGVKVLHVDYNSIYHRTELESPIAKIEKLKQYYSTKETNTQNTRDVRRI